MEYGAGARLNEQSVLNAFKEIYGENSKDITADLAIKVNVENSFFTVMLKGNNGKDVFIKTEGLEVYKVKK